MQEKEQRMLFFAGRLAEAGECAIKFSHAKRSFIHGLGIVPGLLTMRVLLDLAGWSRRFCGIWGACLALSVMPAPSGAATQAVWSGAVSSNFEIAGNWTVVPADDLTSHDASFAGAPTNQPQLTQSRRVAGLRWTTSPGGWSLGSTHATNVLTVGTGGLIASGAGTATNFINAALAIDGTQTWQTASSSTLLFSNSLVTRGASLLTIGTSSNAGRVVFSPAAATPVLFADGDSGCITRVRILGLFTHGGTVAATS